MDITQTKLPEGDMAEAQLLIEWVGICYCLYIK